MKRNLFSKLKDYNYILDKMLEEKCFSEDAKNLILSMIYKIESSYKDYSQIKGIYQKQNDFIDEIISIISNYCKYIFLVDPKKEEVKLLKKENVLALTDERDQRIYAYPTEQAVLYGILDIKPKYFYIPKHYYYIKNQFQKILVEGTILNSTEVIRNFNGWSWNFAEDANINHVANMIYQAIRILIDENFLKEWENDSSGKVDYIYELRKELNEYYGKEISKSFYLAMARLIIAVSPRELKNKIKREYNRVYKSYDNMKDKTLYIYRVSEEKKRLTAEIEEKDIMLNDRQALITEFDKRNKVLPLDKQIFNISDLAEIIQREREQDIKKIKKLNDLVRPANYSQLKNELYEKLQIMSVIVEDKNIRDYAIAFQKEVIKCFEKIMTDINSKEEIIDIIYKIRYYRKIRITENEKLEDISVLFTHLNKILKTVVTKACKEKIFNIFCKDIEYNYRIIEVALDTTVSNYEDVDIALKIVDDNLEITIYDNEIIEKQVEIEYQLTAKDLNVKQKKQIPMYVF